jgi:RIO kinase 1
MDGNEVVFIDMGQSVTLDHPNAMEFLMRDVHNVTRFFRKKGVRIEDGAVADAVLGE